MKRLANGRETRIMVGGGADVVESDDGYIFGHAKIGIAERADRSDRGDIVERNQCGKTAFLLQQLLNDRVAQLRGSQISFKSNREFRANLDAYFSCHRHNRAPPV